MAGCNKNQPTPQVQQCTIEGAKAPSWVCDGGAMMEGGLFGVGSSEKNPLGISFQRTEAAAAARDALARQLKIKVKNMFTIKFNSNCIISYPFNMMDSFKVI